jgi:SH3 domain protein
LFAVEKGMSRLQFVVGIILVVWLTVQPGWAAKAYVTDSFKVTLRTGPSNENKIIAMPSSGQPVKVLDSRGDWSRVRLLGRGVDYKEGWMLSRFLVDRLPWEVQAKSLKDENTHLKEQLALNGKKLSEAVHRERAARSTLETAQKEVQRLAKENEVLQSSERSKWFAIGALVLLFGLMIGFVMGRQQKKHRLFMYF